MTDQASIPPGHGGGRLDPLQILFWASVTVGVAAAGIAITAGPSVGRGGAILLILLAAAGLVLFLWMSRGAGRKHGAFPERGVIEASMMNMARSEFQIVEALDEPALVTDRSHAPLVSNLAYVQLAEAAGVTGESDRPPILSRIFGADPVLSAPMFRLSKAAAAGLARREVLPSTALTPGGPVKRLEASVNPLPSGRALWRLRELSADEGAPAEDAQRMFLEDAPMGFFVARSDGAVDYINPALRAVLGWGDEPARIKVKDFVRDDVSRVMRRDRRGFGASRTKIVLKARDGQETSASAVTFWPADPDDDSARVLIFFQETESGEAALELGGSRQVAQTSVHANGVFANAPFGAAVLDGADPASATLLDSNPALMEMSQGRASPGVAFADLFDASDGPSVLAQRLRKALNEPTELLLAGSPPTAAHVHLARGEGGAIAYLVNVSEQRELEQRLAQSEKMREIGELAAGVAHDFNNLLTVVMQTCSYLLRRHPIGDADYPLLQEISDNATSARELSEMLRAYARQQTFAREIFDVSDFIGSRQELVRRVVGESIKFELRHGRDVPLVKVDKTQIERVVLNLATNARDAMTPAGGVPKDGKLLVRTMRTTAEEARALGHNPMEDGVYALIEVEDSGSGIKPEHAAKIFRPFHSTKDSGKGTGLGLATSYGIVKQSGGYLFFTSKMGVGTTFRIYLPAHEPTTEELADIAAKERAILAPPTRDVAGRGKILFVEDLPAVRRSIARNLRECGYEVEEAENGEDALEILKATGNPFDIIISDVSMPIMTGPEMLKEAGPELINKSKVLFLSGYAPENFSNMLEQYPVHYMSKPVTMEQLVSRVKDLLAAN